jgi:hypothetical protein
MVENKRNLFKNVSINFIGAKVSYNAMRQETGCILKKDCLFVCNFAVHTVCNIYCWYKCFDIKKGLVDPCGIDIYLVA